MKKLFVVHSPSMRGTPIPEFYYTFANDKDEAISKVEYKWCEMDPKTTARELREDELEKLVISTNFYG